MQSNEGNISTWDEMAVHTSPLQATIKAIQTGYGDGLFDETKGCKRV